jgi:2-keto-4-pentenoate hydratase/2-oxohepta-3-ene-1,7-dioic acid hydratase in catechol pathway
MKIGRVDYESHARAAVFTGEVARILEQTVTVPDLLVANPEERARLASLVSAELPLSQVRLLAPVQPPTIRDFSVFEQHIEGVIKDANPDAVVPKVWYESPFCYFTNPNALTGPGDEIPVPPGCERLDLELEVAAVIGRAGTNLTPGAAAQHIAGYTIFNDWSARDLQAAEMRLGLGMCKGKDFANTLGPWIVTADELEPHLNADRLDLELRATINGKSLGIDTLANMAWSFPELVSYASRGTWVQTGDVLGSGTCGNGCLLEMWGRHGRGFAPPLAPGDVVSLHVEGIGSLTNTVVPGVKVHGLPVAAPRRSPARPPQWRGSGPGMN